MWLEAAYVKPRCAHVHRQCILCPCITAPGAGHKVLALQAVQLTSHLALLVQGQAVEGVQALLLRQSHQGGCDRLWVLTNMMMIMIMVVWGSLGILAAVKR
jgi:hypothetical protein